MGPVGYQLWQGRRAAISNTRGLLVISWGGGGLSVIQGACWLSVGGGGGAICNTRGLLVISYGGGGCYQ